MFKYTGGMLLIRAFDNKLCYYLLYHSKFCFTSHSCTKKPQRLVNLHVLYKAKQTSAITNFSDTFKCSFTALNRHSSAPTHHLIQGLQSPNFENLRVGVLLMQQVSVELNALFIWMHVHMRGYACFFLFLSTIYSRNSL